MPTDVVLAGVALVAMFLGSILSLGIAAQRYSGRQTLLPVRHQDRDEPTAATQRRPDRR